MKVEAHVKGGKLVANHGQTTMLSRAELVMTEQPVDKPCGETAANGSARGREEMIFTIGRIQRLQPGGWLDMGRRFRLGERLPHENRCVFETPRRLVHSRDYRGAAERRS